MTRGQGVGLIELCFLKLCTKNNPFEKKSLLRTAFFFGIQKQMIRILLFSVNENFC